MLESFYALFVGVGLLRLEDLKLLECVSEEDALWGVDLELLGSFFVLVYEIGEHSFFLFAVIGFVLV